MIIAETQVVSPNVLCQFSLKNRTLEAQINGFLLFVSFVNLPLIQDRHSTTDTHSPITELRLPNRDVPPPYWSGQPSPTLVHCRNTPEPESDPLRIVPRAV